jgi:excisionase family DNA binding protein
MNSSVPEGYMTCREIAEILEVSSKSINTYCINGILEGAKKIKNGKNHSWIVPRDAVDKYKVQKEEIDNGTFIIQNNAAKLLNTSFQEIDYLRKNFLNENDKFRFFSRIYVNKEAIIICFNNRSVDDNFLSVYEAAEKLQITASTLKYHCQTGNISNAKKVRNQWFVPIEYIKNKIEQKLEIKQNYMTINEFADHLGVSKMTVFRKINDGILPHFILIDNVWRIKTSDIPIYKEDVNIFFFKPKDYSRKKVDQSKDTLIKGLNERISKVNKPHLKLFTKLFLEWCEGQISKSRSKYNNLRSLVSDFVKIYTLIISLFPRDFDKDTQNFTEEILAKTEASIRLHEKFNLFLKYANGQMDIVPQKKIKVTYIKKNDEDKEIYSPEIYQGFNLYVREIDNHIPKACKSPQYANMWVYVLLHLTDVWRHSDLIEKIPNINLEQIGVYKHTWFMENRLSLEQCQKIVNELYLKLRPEVTNKTRSYLTFLVEPTLIESVAHAIVISEIHRRKYKRENLLFTFLSNSLVPIHLSKHSGHLRFFDERPELKVFRNQTMNNSTMTYLHYSIIEEDADNADVALSVPQQARSHEQQDTTRIYVSVTNKDGSVNRVSQNILQRGNFGWLYNFMIIQAMEGKKAVQTMEERTKMIEGFRNDIAPMELENWAHYINTERLKRVSVIKQLLKMPSSELTCLIKKIFNQEIPAKTKPGQCIISPSCKYPECKNCFGCEYFIPQYYVLIEAAKEFNRLIKSMNEASYESTFIRDKKWVLTILDIYTEAKVYLKPELVNGFLSPKEIKTGIASLKNKEFIQ